MACQPLRLRAPYVCGGHRSTRRRSIDRRRLAWESGEPLACVRVWALGLGAVQPYRRRVHYQSAAEAQYEEKGERTLGNNCLRGLFLAAPPRPRALSWRSTRRRAARPPSPFPLPFTQPPPPRLLGYAFGLPASAPRPPRRSLTQCRVLAGGYLSKLIRDPWIHEHGVVLFCLPNQKKISRKNRHPGPEISSEGWSLHPLATSDTWTEDRRYRIS